MEASNAKGSAAAARSGREIVVTRVFDAPRELVFEAWTDPRQIVQWWGPNGFTTTTQEMDVSPGGHWRFVMHGPDGTDYKNHIVYIEVVKPERLVYKHVPEKGTEPVSFETTVTLTDLGGKTEVTMRALFPSAAALEHVVRKYGALEGATQTMGRLGEFVARRAAASRDLTLTRTFDAPRELVFRAFTEPDRLARWWGPHGFTNPRCEVDPRPGGVIRVDMRAPDGTVYPMTGQYHEIVAPERLVFTTAALDKDGQRMFEVRNVLTFGDQGGKTRLTLHASPSRLAAGAERFLAGMEEGWSQSFERLARELAA